MHDDDDCDQFDDGRGPLCPRCLGFTTVACHCGGDLCFCQNNGERDCPLCYGEGVADPKRAEKYLEQEREMAALMRRLWKEYKVKRPGKLSRLMEMDDEPLDPDEVQS